MGGSSWRIDFISTWRGALYWLGEIGKDDDPIEYIWGLSDEIFAKEFSYDWENAKERISKRDLIGGGEWRGG